MNDEFPPRAQATPAVPALGSYVIDTRTGRLGQVMDTHAGYVQLRPPRGGIEWYCPPAAVRPASEADETDEHTKHTRTESRWSQ